MKKEAFILIALSALSGTTQAGDPGACYSISDTDARTYCLAKAHLDPGRCYAIKDHVIKAKCLADLRGIPSK